MKREFLESLGLEKDTVDAVMAEYGRGIGAMKQRCDMLEEQCDALKERIPKLERRISELDGGLSESEEKYSRLIGSVIARAVDDAGFSSVLAGETAAAVLREEFEAGNDIYAAIDVMRENDPAAFAGKSVKSRTSLPRLRRFLLEAPEKAALRGGGCDAWRVI